MDKIVTIIKKPHNTTNKCWIIFPIWEMAYSHSKAEPTGACAVSVESEGVEFISITKGD